MEIEKDNPNSTKQTIIINQDKKQTNGIGTAGFALAIIAIFISCIPILGQIVWLLGLIFSFIGVFKSPRGLSIAGLIISLIGIILIVVITIFGFGLASMGALGDHLSN